MYLGVHLGRVTYEGQGASGQVRVTPFSRWVSAAEAGASLNVRVSSGLTLGVGIQTGVGLLSASARLGAQQEVQGQGAQVQLETLVGWQW